MYEVFASLVYSEHIMKMTKLITGTHPDKGRVCLVGACCGLLLVTPEQVLRCRDASGRTGLVGKYTSFGVWVFY